MSRSEWVKFSWEVVKGTAVGVAAVFSFLANQNAQKASAEAENAKVAIAQRSQQADLDIKAYEFVEKTLSLDPAAGRNRGPAAAAIVNALTNPPLRDQLQSALRAVTTDPALARQIDDAKQFDLESYSQEPPKLRQPQPSRSALPDRGLLARFSPVSLAHAQAAVNELSGYRVDIFYCESASASITESRRKRAAAASQVLAKSATGVAVRVRLLPTLVQARPGYASFSDEIRFNDEGNEKAAAAQLANAIGIDPRDVHVIDFRTPGYISAFYCAGR
jgi:hypothetical protein